MDPIKGMEAPHSLSEQFILNVLPSFAIFSIIKSVQELSFAATGFLTY